jgi:hypothetical protein
MDTPPNYSDDSIDFAEMFARVRRGLALTLGLALLGLALGLLVSLVVNTKQTAVSTMRVTFGFPGFERGVYPDGTKFQADDLRAPDIINEALKRLGVQNLAPDVTSKIRGVIGVSGFVSANIVKERDKLRASGQTLPPYFPDEYEISLSLPRDYALDVRQRELLLAEIVNVYLEKFRRSHVQLPPEFGNAFTTLQNADFVEYELILTKELQTLLAYLEQRIDADSDSEAKTKDNRTKTAAAKQFRSPANNLSFQDLHKQTELFTQIRLNDVLSQIYVYGLSKDRNYALVKMDYYLRTLEDQEQRLQEEETVVTGLLGKTQERAQNYVLATKAQNPQGNQPLMDQGFIDSLLANDAYNFLIRRALDAGLAVKRVQAEKNRLQERRARMESFTKGEVKDQAAAIAQTQKALVNLEAGYQDLLAKVRVVLDDYARQEYADAVRISMQARTDSVLRALLIAGAVGLVVGLSAGLGLSLLGIAGRKPAVG